MARDKRFNGSSKRVLGLRIETGMVQSFLNLGEPKNRTVRQTCYRRKLIDVVRRTPQQLTFGVAIDLILGWISVIRRNVCTQFLEIHLTELCPMVVQIIRSVSCREEHSTRHGKKARRNGTMALSRRSVGINTTAISITTATSGCSTVSVAPPPNRRCPGWFHKLLMAIKRLLFDRGQEMHVVMCISKSLPVREFARGR